MTTKLTKLQKVQKWMRGKLWGSHCLKLFLDVSYDISNGAKELGENRIDRFFDLVKKSTFGRFWMTTYSCFISKNQKSVNFQKYFY